jgi:hypothetical protein
MIKKMCIGLRVQYVLFFANFNNLRFLDRFSKNPHISIFHENLSGGSRVVPCGRTDRRPHMTKLIIKVKCTLVQALRLCTGRTAPRGSRGTALLFHDHGTSRR